MTITRIRLENAAKAFYRRCPTEIAREGDAIRRKTWEELIDRERFHICAGVESALDALGVKHERAGNA